MHKIDELFKLKSEKGIHFYLILDTAKKTDILIQVAEVNTELNMLPLFLNTALAEQIEHSPWVIEINEHFLSLLHEVNNQKIGIIYESSIDLEAFQKEIAQLVIADDDKHGAVFLRFYMPYVAEAIAIFDVDLLTSSNIHTLWIPSVHKESWHVYHVEKTQTLSPIYLNIFLRQLMNEVYYRYWLKTINAWKNKEISIINQTAKLIYLLKIEHSASELSVLKWLDWLNPRVEDISFKSLEVLINANKNHALESLEQAKNQLKDKQL